MDVTEAGVYKWVAGVLATFVLTTLGWFASFRGRTITRDEVGAMIDAKVTGEFATLRTQIQGQSDRLKSGDEKMDRMQEKLEDIGEMVATIKGQLVGRK